MKVFFAGAEKGANRKLLELAEVTRFGVNLTHLPIPKKKELLLPEVFSGGEILIYNSVGDEDTHRFDSFVRQHLPHISKVVCPLGYDPNWLGDKGIPLWSDDEDLERLAIMCQKYGRVAVPDKAVTGKTTPRIRSLVSRWDADLVGMTSKVDVIDSLPWDTVVVGSWTSAIRYGETQVWDGRALRRYPAQQKDSARRRHRADIARLNIDPEAVIANDPEAVALLAIRSWKAWEDSMAYETPKKIYPHQEDRTDNSYHPSKVTEPNLDSRGTTIANTPLETRHENERVLLPVMGIETITSVGTQMAHEQGEYTEIDPEEIPVVRYSGALLRQCDNCYLATKCPAFKEHSECGFKLPVEIRTKDQLQAALRSMLEMQTSRVLFARFAEELEGQGLDPALSAEIDRLFNLVDKFKNISDTRDVIRMEVEARGGAGVLSRLFGSRAGEVARELSTPLPNAVVDDMAMEIIDYDE